MKQTTIMKNNVFFLKKKPMPVFNFTIYGISYLPEVSSAPHFRIQGGGGLQALGRTVGQQIECLLLDLQTPPQSKNQLTKLPKLGQQYIHIIVNKEEKL